MDVQRRLWLAGDWIIGEFADDMLPFPINEFGCIENAEDSRNQTVDRMATLAIEKRRR